MSLPDLQQASRPRTYRVLALGIFLASYLPFFRGYVDGLPVGSKHGGPAFDVVLHVIWPLVLYFLLRRYSPDFLDALKAEFKFPGWEWIFLGIAFAIAGYAFWGWSWSALMHQNAELAGLIPDNHRCSVPPGKQYWAVWLLGIYLAATAAFYEELLFKPVIRQVFAGWLHSALAAVASAVLFTSIHLTSGHAAFAVIEAFFYGLVSACIYFACKRKTLIFLMVLHFVSDYLYFTC